MTADTIRAALEAAAKRLCIRHNQCFETRHGMMHGPCEQRAHHAAAAIAAFLRALPGAGPLPTGKWLAAAVKEAARDG